MKTTWLGGILAVVALSLGPAATLEAHGGDPTKIHACVNNNSGEVKIVAPSATCNTNSTATDWNVTGPQGPQGPAGSGGAARTLPMDFTVDCNAGQTIQGTLEQDLIPGDQLLVTGTCHENVVIPQEINRLVLNGQGTTVLAPPDLTGPAITVRGRGIGIQNFTISGGLQGISVFGGGTATIDSNVVQNAGQHGIALTRAATATIVNNTIQNNSVHGISIFSSSSAAIGFRSAQDAVASPNLIVNNGQIGINIGQSSDASIDGNTISGNGSFGINVAEASAARIGFSGITGSFTAANAITNNGRNGIRVAGSSNVGIEGNTIAHNGGAGISVDFSSSVDIGFRGFSNNIQTSTGAGIEVLHSSSARIIGAVISTTGGDGVRVIRASQADVGSTTINASVAGVRVEENSGVNLGSGNTGNSGNFAVSCRTGSYISGTLGRLTGGLGQKDFAIVGTSVELGVPINSEDCIDRVGP